MKSCSKCKTCLSEDNFRKSQQYQDNLFCWCKSCEKEYRKKYPKEKKIIGSKKWILNNPNYIKEYNTKNSDKLKKYRKKYHQINSKRNFERASIWAQNNRKQSNLIKQKWKKTNKIYYNNYIKKRKKQEPSYKLRCIISKSIWYYLKTQNSIKNNSCWKNLPYSTSQLKNHLESLWEPWMNWDNHGLINQDKKTWQIDHIIPQSQLPYDSLNHPNFLICWSLKNLRPLESFQNAKRFYEK